MRRFDWLSEYLARLQDERVVVRHGSTTRLAPAHTLEIDPEDWGRAAASAADFACRWAGIWADMADAETFRLFCLLEKDGDYLILTTDLPRATPLLASHTPWFPAANRPERHIQDLWGIAFGDHPDTRRWTRHQAWPEDRYPLRPDFPVAGIDDEPTPPDDEYPFETAQGAGVYEIPVGPVHAGIIEPGHFRFQAVGERILQLEEHLGYVHKGIEKIAVGRDADGLARLAGRVSGDSTVAHAWAACLAMERAAQIPVPARADALRALLAERERIANHLGDIGAICNDVGFAFALYQFSRLREQWQRRNRELFGHRLLMDVIVPGGLARDPQGLDSLRADHARLRAELEPLFDVLLDHPSLEDRLLGTGRLSAGTARALGCTGYVGKAAGQAFDVRRDNPYGPYARLQVTVPVFAEGDVAARVQVRMQEVLHSLDMLDLLLAELPAGPVRQAFVAPAGADGIGCVDGWRGEIVHYVRFDEAGRIARFFPRDPSWFTWPALERIVLGNIVPDFPVCNKSVNGSYSGHDL